MGAAAFEVPCVVVRYRDHCNHTSVVFIYRVRSCGSIRRDLSNWGRKTGFLATAVLDFFFFPLGKNFSACAKA